MDRIRINNFYTELDSDTYNDSDIKKVENDLLDVKKFYLGNLINRTKLKYIIIKLISSFTELIDVLVLLEILFMDIELDNVVLIITLILNLLVGIILATKEDIKIELSKMKKEYNI